MSILVVAAHADDEVLGCGGTLLQYVDKKDDKKDDNKDEGASVDTYLLVMADGVTSRNLEAEASEEDIEKREGICVQVGLRLFRERPIFLRLPDNSMDKLPLLSVVRMVEEIVECIQPTTIFTHYEHDLNADHRVTYQAVVTACRPFKFPAVRQIYSFEVPSSTELASVPFKPDTFADIEKKTLTEKVQLFRMYVGEDENSPARSGNSLESLAHYRGTQSGCLYAEAFKTVRRCGISVP